MPLARERLHLGGFGGGAGVLRRAHRGNQRWPGLRGIGQGFGAECLRAAFEAGALLGAEVEFKFLRHVDALHQLLKGLGGPQMCTQLLHQLQRVPGFAGLAFQARDLRIDELADPAAVVAEQIADALEREPRLAQQQDLRQPPQRPRAVQAVACRRMRIGAQQAR